jgi:hypothetical protein
LRSSSAPSGCATIEPNLYLATAPGAAERFARAVLGS